MSAGGVKKGTKRERILPYAYARRGVDFDLVEAIIDDDRHVGSIDSAARLVRLEIRDWRQLKMRFSLRVRPDVVSTILPRPTSTTYPVDFLVAARCPATFFRTGWRVSPVSSALDAPTDLEITIFRDQLRGSLEFIPFLIRISTESRTIPGFASRQGSRIASARSWEVRIDAAKRHRGQHLDIRFESFSGVERFREWKDRVYFLDADTESPVLWLNHDHDRVALVLKSEGTVGISARTRDVFFDLISSSVWIQLFLRAAASLDEDGETFFEWQDGVLHEILPEVFPELDDITRRIETRRKAKDPAELPDLIQRVDLVLQKRQSYARHMKALVDEALQR